MPVAVPSFYYISSWAVPAKKGTVWSVETVESRVKAVTTGLSFPVM